MNETRSRTIPRLLTRASIRNERCNLCGVLPQSGLRRDFHAQAIQPSALQPTLLTFHQPFSRFLGDRAGQLPLTRAQHHRDTV